MKISGITAALPAQDLGRAKSFYVEKVGLKAVESDSLEASDGRLGLAVGDGVNRLFVYPAAARSMGEFTQVVLQVTNVRAAVEEMRGRGVIFEEYDTSETRTEGGIARTPDGGEGAWFKDSEGTWSASFARWPDVRTEGAKGWPSFREGVAGTSGTAGLEGRRP
jgi:predicted enzyme related to lactoylglutathione lyase